jgi:pSer/pThr/pTyr-binding forkhead associated (FHA) protein
MDVGLVCDACETFNPMGAAACSRCAGPLSLGNGATAPRGAPSSALSAAAVATSQAQRKAATPSRPPSAGTAPRATGAVAAPAAPAAAAVTCRSCGAPVPADHAFCGACGTPVGTAAAPPRPEVKPAAKARTMFFGAMQASRAKLVLIKGDGLDGVSFTLAGQEHVAGRGDAPLSFDEDPFLSPRHANFFYRDGRLVVRDERSVNGVYIRIRGTREIAAGDRFLIGEQVLEAQSTTAGAEEPAPVADGTYFFASPRQASQFRIVQMLRGGDTGLAYRAPADAVSMGREGNDVNFPDDPFISGRHAKVSFVAGKLTLTDLGSKNGTFLRINQEAELAHGDYVFMGQQLLRVEIV